MVYIYIIYNKGQSEVYTLVNSQGGPQFQGPVYHFKKQITRIAPFQNANNKSVLLLANSYGTLVSLME
jgi:hypothetical protein